eukprot:3665184-Rhodomonas_salina.1
MLSVRGSETPIETPSSSPLSCRTKVSETLPAIPGSSESLRVPFESMSGNPLAWKRLVETLAVVTNVRV